MSMDVKMLTPHTPATIPLMYILFNNVSSVDTMYIQDSLSTQAVALNFPCVIQLYSNIQGVPGGMCQTSGGCSLC